LLKRFDDGLLVVVYWDLKAKNYKMIYSKGWVDFGISKWLTPVGDG
jgi:hypothetical protein